MLFHDFVHVLRFRTFIIFETTTIKCMILFWFKKKFLGVFTLTKPIGPNQTRLNGTLRKLKRAYVLSFSLEFSSLKICHCLLRARVANKTFCTSANEIHEGYINFDLIFIHSRHYRGIENFVGGYLQSLNAKCFVQLEIKLGVKLIRRVDAQLKRSVYYETNNKRYVHLLVCLYDAFITHTFCIIFQSQL